MTTYKTFFFRVTSAPAGRRVRLFALSNGPKGRPVLLAEGTEDGNLGRVAPLLLEGAAHRLAPGASEIEDPRRVGGAH